MLFCPAHMRATLTFEPERTWVCQHGCRWRVRKTYELGRPKDTFDPAPTGDVTWAYGTTLAQLTDLRARYWREQI